MSNLVQYLPHIYKDVLETDTLMATEDKLFEELAGEILAGENNQFIRTANEYAIGEYERILGILARPEESVDFRRQRVLNRFSLSERFTMKTLSKKLDEFIGEGAWTAYMDPANPYTLIIESSAANQEWYNELLITIMSSKPANIVFVNKPLVAAQIKTNESISYSQRLWNYRLGVSWELGALPFVSFHDQGEIKSMSTPSIKSELLNDIASFTAADIKQVRINGTIVVNTTVGSTSSANIITVEYIIPQMANVTAITRIELLDAEGKVLTEAPVYIPALTDLVLKHTLTVKEG